MKTVFNKSLLAAALAATMGIASTSAMAVLNPFTINEGSVVGTPANVLTNAGGFTGIYNEIVTFDGAGNFATSILWQAGSLYDALNAPYPGTTDVYLNAPGSAGYAMYGLFQGGGTYSTSGTTTTFNFNPGGLLNVWIDPTKNTSFVPPLLGNGGYAVSGVTGTDDYLVASGVPTGGTGQLNPMLSTCGPSILNPGGLGINCGSFGTSTSFDLTVDGAAYFTSPAPFYNMSFESGQLKDFTPTATQHITGSLDVTFGNKVPEPASVALLGIGLVGLSLSLRRRKQG